MRTTVGIRGYLTSIALVTAASFLCQLLQPYINPTNMVMVYLLAVVLAAVRLGLRPAVFTAFAGILAFDFFFVPPRFTFRVADTEYVITFLGLFIVGAVISTLVTNLREHSEALQEKEVQTAALYHLSRDLAAAPDLDAIMGAIIRNLEGSMNVKLAILLPNQGKLEVAAASKELQLDDHELNIACWTFNSRRAAGFGAETYRGSQLYYMPIKSPVTTLGVLGLKPEHEPTVMPGQSRLLEAFATQIALALERAQLARQAEQAQVLQARESLEKALLNSISHDLRTPLVMITGGLGSILDEGDRLDDASRRELLEAAREEAERLNRFVGNLLDMTRLEAGEVCLRRELCDIQDLCGCAIAVLEKRLRGRNIEVKLAEHLPMVSLDMVLMTQVLVNLLENALKYSPSDSTIEIASYSDEEWLTIEVADRGPGIPEGELEKIFTKFYRIPIPEGAGGTGLGLSICKGIVEGHGGSIHAENRAEGGLNVIVQVPIHEPAQELGSL